MKMNVKSLIFFLTGVFMMASCSNEMEEQLAGGEGNGGQEVKFTTGIGDLSRTVIADGTLVTSFTEGDEMGVFAYKGDQLVAKNVKYTYNGSQWTSDAAITSENGVQLSYYAYYPYDETVTDPANIPVTVNADQTGGFSKDDVLTAQNTTAEAGAANVSLNFAHAFAMVQVGIKDGLTTDTEAAVTLESIQPTAVVNAQDGSVGAASGETVSIKMKKTAEKLEYRAIVPAQELASGSKLLTVVAGGKTYVVTYSSTENKTVSYVKGKALQITVNSLNALPEGNEVTIGGSITDWESGTSNPGEGDITEMPVESLDLSGFTGFAELQTLGGWNSDKVTGESSFWFKRETTSGLVTYGLTEAGELSMTLLQGGARATWNSNSIGYHSGAKFDHTKKYTLTFTARAENTESGNNIGVALLNSTDTKLFCKGGLTGTLYTGGVTNAEKTYTVTFDFSQSSTAAKAAFGDNEGGSATTEDETVGGINIVFFNNTNTASMSSASTLYVKDVKLNMVTE